MTFAQLLMSGSVDGLARNEANEDWAFGRALRPNQHEPAGCLADREGYMSSRSQSAGMPPQ